jgi:hypothetical protein
MADMSERHEVRVHGQNGTIVFVADSEDGRLVIRQERDGHRGKDVCAALADPDELRTFFRGLRRILPPLGHTMDIEEPTAARGDTSRALTRRNDERDAVVAQARQRHPQAFAPWKRDEEREIRRHRDAGETIPAISWAHTRSPRAIERRLRRPGALPRRG